MSLANHSRKRLADLDGIASGNVKLRCEMSKAFEKSGDYEKACEALGGLWRGIGERPDVEGLAPDWAAEVLLQVGRLTSRLGRARLVDGAQESAKNLISESTSLFEKAGSAKKVAEAQTEIAVCYWREGAFDEARVMLKEALSRLSAADGELRATALITLAIVESSASRHEEAEKWARAAVQSLEDGGSQSLLAEALAAQGVALARLGRHAEARRSLERAVETAERGGDHEGAGQAAMAVVEELFEQTTARELGKVFERAAALLSGSQNPDTLARLNACARRVIHALSSSVATAGAGEESPATVEERWDGFSLKREVLRYESELIADALADACGVVSHAAKLLGFRHHQTFVALLNNRHNNLLHARTPINPRKRSAARVRATRRPATRRLEREARPVTILFVEDNKLVADAIRETLEFEGWRVEWCPDGDSALSKIESDDHFDLILLDDGLPGMSGLELTRRARLIPHRRGTPIVIVSATNCQTAARDAGANAFVKKPQDILTLAQTVSRLLDIKATV